MIQILCRLKETARSLGATPLVLIAGISAYGCGGGSDSNTGPGNNNPPPPPPPMQTAPPVISMVEWMHASGCTANTATDVTIITTVTDADTPAGNLTFTGGVSNCTGSINAATATVNCPEAASYSGNVTVTDPENNSASKSFTMSPCQDGSAS
ncbi:MAG: hypothetical protein ACE5HT_08155 [Gemmatimonadales bacterium]